MSCDHLWEALVRLWLRMSNAESATVCREDPDLAELCIHAYGKVKHGHVPAGAVEAWREEISRSARQSRSGSTYEGSDGPYDEIRRLRLLLRHVGFAATDPDRDHVDRCIEVQRLVRHLGPES